MEPRAAIGEFDRATGDYTLWTTSQNPHVIRLLMGAFVLGIPEHKLRVIAPDVGGGFGSKIYHYAEEAIVTGHRRKSDGRSSGWLSVPRASCLTPMAATMSPTPNWHWMRTVSSLGCGCRRSPTWARIFRHSLRRSRHTFTPPCWPGSTRHRRSMPRSRPSSPTPFPDAYRGAGRPEACYLIERIVENAARELGIDKTELRRRNFIPPTAMPYDTPVALQYDCGLFEKNLDQALALIDYQGFPARKAESGGHAACCAASASPATSKPVVSPPATWPVHWVPAPGFTNRVKSASTRPVR